MNKTVCANNQVT